MREARENQDKESIGVVTRFIEYHEISALLDLYRHLNPEDPFLTTGEVSDLWDAIFNDPHLHILVTEADGQIVSSCTLAVIRNLTRGARPYGLIENVVTHAEHRQRGYGGMVMEKAIDVARNAGCYKILLLTSSTKAETLRFYENAGFRRETKTGFVYRL